MATLKSKNGAEERNKERTEKTPWELYLVCYTREYAYIYVQMLGELKHLIRQNIFTIL